MWVTVGILNYPNHLLGQLTLGHHPEYPIDGEGLHCPEKLCGEVLDLSALLIDEVLWCPWRKGHPTESEPSIPMPGLEILAIPCCTSFV